jgi:predicted dehydrogenase
MATEELTTASEPSNDYAVTEVKRPPRPRAPKLPYKALDPKRYKPRIGLIACGNISRVQLTAYKAAGYNVVALCDPVEQRAIDRQRDFYPEAATYSDYREVLKRDDIEIVDITTHPHERGPIIEAALQAKKHVLSQKPFVTDLDYGERLADIADQNGVKLAVNQNGRWAPHFSYMRQAIKAGLIGEVLSAHMAVHWDHNWIVGTEFEKVRHIVLYDYAIHWFDIVTCFFGQRDAKRVYASVAWSCVQKAKPALLGQAMIEYEGGQASLAFDADVHYGPLDTTYIAGSGGTLTSIGKDYQEQKVTIYNQQGSASPKLVGSWFPDGFHATMGELLRAIEEKREPENSARNNLRSLALCFAAVRSADTGEPQVPGMVRKLPE